MVKKIIAVVCIIAVFCCLAAVDVIKQQNVTVSKHFDELEIAFTATDHTASIVESKDYVFYAATDGIYRKDKNSGDLCTRIVKGETTALQIFSNTLYYVIEETKLCSVDFDGNNFNEVYEKPQDYVNRTITDYVAFGNGLVIADSAFPLYYDIINKKQYNIFEKPTTLTSYDAKNQMLYFNGYGRKDLSQPRQLGTDDYATDFLRGPAHERDKTVSCQNCFYVLYENKLFKEDPKNTWQVLSFTNEKIIDIKSNDTHIYVLFEKHAERIGILDGTGYSEYLGEVKNYNGKGFTIVEDAIYYTTDYGYEKTERSITDSIIGSMFLYKYTDDKWKAYEYAWHNNLGKITDKKITTIEEFMSLAKEKYYKSDSSVLNRVVQYLEQNYWDLSLVNTANVDYVLKEQGDPWDFDDGSSGLTFDGNSGKIIEIW